jgi:putative peptidoglycan lipid II flippase
VTTGRVSTGSGGLGRASVLLASGTIVSRLLGFASALVLAAALGTYAVGDVFALANQLPNNIYAIIAGGLLSAILVPQIVRAEKHEDGGQLYINRLITLGIVAFLLIAVLATVLAPAIFDLYSQQSSVPGKGISDEERQLGILFAYWCLPQIFFYAIYSLLGEVLNARKIFGPFTWAPVINNVVAIAGLVVFIAIYGAYPSLKAAGTWDAASIALVAGTATLGVLGQSAFLLFFWRRAGLRYRPDFRWRGVGLGSAGKAAAWTFAMITVTQLGGIIQNNVATLASGSGASVSVLRYSWLIFMLPHSIAAVSIATAYFTRMSSHARDGRMDAVRSDLSASLRSIGLVLVFSTVGLIVLAIPFSRLFSDNLTATQQMAPVLTVYLLGLIQFSVLFVLQRTFYALEDTRTPFFYTVLQTVLFVIGALAVSLWPVSMIGVGIAGVTSLAGTVQLVVAAILLRRRLGGLDAKRVTRQYGVFLLATIPAGLVGAALLWLLGGFVTDSKLTAAASMVLVGGVMGLLYLGVLFAVKNPELRTIIGPVIGRLRRSK